MGCQSFRLKTHSGVPKNDPVLQQGLSSRILWGVLQHDEINVIYNMDYIRDYTLNRVGYFDFGFSPDRWIVLFAES